MRKKFILPEAEAMAGLVRRVLEDVVEARMRLDQFRERSLLLHDNRLSNDYATRRKYYRACEQREQAIADIDRLRGEAQKLGVEIIDLKQGIAAFPFRWSRNTKSRKSRDAYFLLKLTDGPEIGISHWRFSGERAERRVPPHWLGQMSSPIIAEMAY